MRPVAILVEAFRSRRSNRLLWLIGFAATVLVGALFRLVWVEDIEYKPDERWTFEASQRIGRTDPWPWVGMPTSVVLPHPGMSIWIFVILSRLWGAETPPELARAVQLLNIAAILLLGLFVWRGIPAGDREPWLWAIALYCLNPLAVIFDRKIWPPTIVPMATVWVVIGWWYRRRTWGAFLWGVAGALIGQLHTGALIFALALLIWTAVLDRRSVAWRPWLIGSLLAGWPLIPWALELLAQRSRAGMPAVLGARWPVPTFYTRWVTEPFGFGAEYTLGQKHFLDFLSTPTLAGHSTYLMAAAHVALAAIALVILVRAAGRLRRGRVSLGECFIGRQKGETFLINAALWGYGGLLTLSTLSVHRHYMIVLHVIKFLWVALLVFFGADDRKHCSGLPRRLLLALCILQAVVTAGLLYYIHVTQVIDGEYWATWRAQQSGYSAPR